MDISRVLFWIFFILSVIFVIGYIIGDSPTFEQGILLIVLNFLIEMNRSVKRSEYLINSLNNRVNIIENRMDNIETKVDKLER